MKHAVVVLLLATMIPVWVHDCEGSIGTFWGRHITITPKCWLI
jgi:hypothetical protein